MRLVLYFGDRPTELKAREEEVDDDDDYDDRRTARRQSTGKRLPCAQVMSAIGLRACYAMPGTDLVHSTMRAMRCPHYACYAMPGTDLMYGTIRLLRSYCAMPVV
eukprot:3170459-Rhodomonas_salina.2